MNKYLIQEKTLVDIANSIRAKTGSTEPIIAEDFPSAIEAIEVGISENLDEEIATQEAKIASQDELIINIVTALEGKATGGNSEVSMVTIHLGEEADGWADILTIPELIGAKYFIIQGNSLNAEQINNTNYTADAGNIYQIIYLNGLVYMSYFERIYQKNNCSITNKIINDTNVFSFDEITGTINVGTTGFCKISTDTSTTDVIYTVYRIG